ncbi:hypothetical protein [Mesorhizobium sp. 1B3]|uniref:hypothetical protein n=1 Tax=Mesorhizobium sp. 1B3 TaxID=3243599 RepID=UPI003D96B578
MSVETVGSLALSGAIGAVFGGVITNMWYATKQQENRCQFLKDFGRQLDDAFSTADTLLTNMDLPKEVRIALIRLLAGHADTGLGSRMADAFLQVAFQPRDDDETNPLTEAMTALFSHNRSLAKSAHMALSTLVMGLLVVHKGDTMQVDKVKSQAAKDPETLLNRVFQAFRNGGGGTNHKQPKFA